MYGKTGKDRSGKCVKNIGVFIDLMILYIMANYKKNNHYSSTDIQKYLEGKLSPIEMHAMEMAALDDPFLADAIEGIKTVNDESGSASFQQDLLDLKKKLQKRIEKEDQKTILSSFKLWQRVAAAGVLLIGLSSVVYYAILKNPSGNKSIAVEKQRIPTDSNKQEEEKNIASKDSSIYNPLAKPEKKKITEAIPADKEFTARVRRANVEIKKEETEATTKKAAPAASAAASVPVAEDRDIVVKTYPDSMKPKAKLVPTTVMNQMQGKVAGLDISKTKPENINWIKGTVVDENKNPIPGATVILKNTKTGTTTDVNGQFKLNGNKQDSISHIVVNSVGYQPVDLALNSHNPNNTIQLQESTQSLNEVVVVGYSTEEKEDDMETFSPSKKDKPIIYKAEPSIGWLGFNEYISKNKKILTSDSVIKGNEIIRFWVDNSSPPNSFKIKKSLSPAHDAEAIRLVREGPTWRLLKKKKVRVTLAIKF